MVRKNRFGFENWQIHQNDLHEAVNKLETYDNIQYFLDLARMYSLKSLVKKNKPQIAVLGMSIPEELIYAVGAEPLWILGGSFGAAQFADLIVPRDTDSVSKASLGYLSSEIFTFTKDVVLTIVPVTSDSMRKIGYLLSKERDVFAVDFPPVKEEGYSLRKWAAQMKALIQAMENKTSSRLNKKSLLQAVEMINQAKRAMKRLLLLSFNSPELLPGILTAFLINTYYFTGEIAEWTLQLEMLNNEIERRFMQKSDFVKQEQPRLLITGSPVLFPNFKLPTLLQELGVFQIAIGHEMIFRINNIIEFSRKKQSLASVLELVVSNCYLKDTSGAFVDGKSRMDLLKELEKQFSFHGVIYHVLKGQIEYDFELERYELYFAKKDIPFFRLETDYNQQDIEQLKIRLEAFLEMIESKYFKMRA
jgi:benzoyl-CoA reductase/2-hydroxyglutaryl-CoA dehydratase subunit BcrC/BadD/HgdB